MKNFVEVIARFDEAGQIIPLYIVFNNHNYKIDKIKEIIPAASMKSGGIGLRYTCKINGQIRYLFLEDTHWFIDKE